MTDTVEMADGTVYGTTSKTTAQFLGIPYAEPPIGERRWAAPVQIAKFKERQATTHGSVCPQLGATDSIINAASSEDCLFINVWAPRKPGPHPVMLWFYGGSYVFGSNSEGLYDGRKLSEAGDVIIVTANYRLGPLGFMVHPGAPNEGNVGLLDQREAMRWVQRNIASFGGDPKNVTIFGESAGAGAICGHVLSPESWPYFHRAVMESAPCTGFAFPTLEYANAQARDVGTAVGCTEPDAAAQLACMRSKSMSQILEALPLNAFNIYGEGVAWFPSVDGVQIQDQPVTLFGKGQVAPVPIIVGSNADEGSLFFPKKGIVQDEATMRTALSELFPQSDLDTIIARYPPGADARETSIRLVSDIFTCDARRIALAAAKNGQPVYRYYFARDFYDVVLGLGAFHGSEMPFIWDNPYFGLGVLPAGAPIREAMQGYWTTFARTGDPNGDKRLTWPKYGEGAETLMQFNRPIETKTDVLADECAFWDSIRQPVVR